VTTFIWRSELVRRIIVPFGVRICGVAISLPFLLFSAASAGMFAGSDSTSGVITLRSGLTARYAYYFDRNALRGAVQAEESIVALTDSGNLLRIDKSTLTQTREWFGSVPVACLGQGQNDTVLAGFADGRIVRVDANTLKMSELARLPNRIEWLGEVADDPGRTRKPDTHRGRPDRHDADARGKAVSSDSFRCPRRPREKGLPVGLWADQIVYGFRLDLFPRPQAPALARCGLRRMGWLVRLC
jgi:hypothetical protein